MHRIEPNRREFLQTTGAIAVTAVSAQGAAPGVPIVANPEEPMLQSIPVRWAMGQLHAELAAKKIPVQQVATVADAAATNHVVVVRVGFGPEESYRLAPLSSISGSGRQAMDLEGVGVAGVKHGLLEIA